MKNRVQFKIFDVKISRIGSIYNKTMLESYMVHWWAKEDISFQQKKDIIDGWNDI